MTAPEPSAPQTPAQDEIQVGSFFLETLTTGMYEDPFHCIREYVQNGFDAIQDAIRAGALGADEGRILISIGGSQRSPSLGIRDNGAGIAAVRAYTTLVSLGASRKMPTLHAGFRGIGRLAGVAYCTTLRFTTSTKGEPVATVVEFDCGHIRSFFSPGAEPVDVREVMRSSVRTRSIEAAPDDHFTEVEMLGLVNLGVEFVDLVRLQPYLREVCPVEYSDSFDYADRVRSLAEGFGDKLLTVHVETKQKRERKPIVKPYKNSYPTGRKNTFSKLHDIEIFTSREHGWYGWIGVSNFPGELADDTVAGVRFRIKNIQVGDEETIQSLAEELTPAGSERRLQRWAVGEVFITNPQVVPNARRDGFEDSAAWRDVKRDIKEKVVKRVIKLVRSASSTRSAMKAIADVLKSLTAQVDVPELTAAEKTRIEGAVKKQLQDLASPTKLVGADPKEVSSLTAKFKELAERLAKLVPVEPNPSGTRTGIGESSNRGNQELNEAPDSNTSGNDVDEEDVAQARVEVILEVLAAELPPTQAQRLAGRVADRLDEMGM